MFPGRRENFIWDKACNEVLTSHNKITPPPPEKKVTPPVLKMFNPRRLVLKLFAPSFDLKQKRCEANSHTSYPT